MEQGEKTGWPPGLLQDDSKGLSRWFASRIDARWTVRRVCAEIMRKREKPLQFPTIDPSMLPKETESTFRAISDPKNAHLFSKEAAYEAFKDVPLPKEE